MTDGTNWIANLVKLFNALISPREILQPEQPVASPSQGGSPEAPVDNSPEPDALSRQQKARIETALTEEVKTCAVRQDDESRRQLIRQLFNEYWTGVEDKPPTFAERLEIAEKYINERLADRDVGWRLDTAMRKRLGLPSSRIAS